MNPLNLFAMILGYLFIAGTSVYCGFYVLSVLLGKILERADLSLELLEFSWNRAALKSRVDKSPI